MPAVDTNPSQRKRRSSLWFWPPNRPERNDGLAPKVSYGIRVVGGGVYVVDVLDVAPPFVTVRAWGTVERLKIFIADVESWAVVGPHDYAQARKVMQRQREGLTAA